MILPLHLGPLSAAPYALYRSRFRWLRADGQPCLRGDLIGYCHLKVRSKGLGQWGPAPFSSARTLQVALASPVDGRLRLPPGDAAGGSSDVLPIREWDPDETIAAVDCEGDLPPDGAPRLLLLAGDRVAWAVDVDTGLLPGWNRLARGWWGHSADAPTNLLALGVCDATGFVRGDDSGFVEMFSAARGAAHLAHSTEHPSAPCSKTILETHNRTPTQRQAIREDIGRALAIGAPAPEDFVFMGALASQLGPSPTLASHDILTPTGHERQPPAKILLLSALSEPERLIRHRRLGYHLQIYDHNLRAAGPLSNAWLKSAFEPVAVDLENVKDDLIRLSDALRVETGARLLVVNRMSTSGRETIDNYAPFDIPLNRSLMTVSAKMTNLMLEDLADDGKLTIVDLDALAADLGGAANLSDGVHQSGRLQTALRAETLALAGAITDVA